MSGAASPVALFTIGAILWRSIQLADDPTPLRHVIAIALIKLVLHPMLILLLGALVYQYSHSITASQINTLTLIAALPSASNVAMLAERYYANTGRIARIVMVSTVLSFATVSLMAWMLVGTHPTAEGTPPIAVSAGN